MLDAQPITLGARALMLARLVDLVVLVVEAGVTTRKDVHSAIDAISAATPNLRLSYLTRPECPSRGRFGIRVRHAGGGKPPSPEVRFRPASRAMVDDRTWHFSRSKTVLLSPGQDAHVMQRSRWSANSPIRAGIEAFWWMLGNSRNQVHLRAISHPA